MCLPSGEIATSTSAMSPNGAARDAVITNLVGSLGIGGEGRITFQTARPVIMEVRTAKPIIVSLGRDWTVLSIPVGDALEGPVSASSISILTSPTC